MLTDTEREELKKSAREVRKNIVKMVHNSKSGHPGGSLSGADILTVLYKKSLNIPSEWDKSPEFETRDRFILSKGHASPLLYSILAMKGIIPEEELMTFRKLGSRLQGHPDKKYLLGVEASTGSLGQGVSIAIGVALAYKLDKKSNKVFAIAGDGEAQEGTFWESAMAASNYKLDNYTLIVDYNGLQIDGKNEEVMSLGDLESKLKAFGFEVFTVDGHNEEDLEKVFKTEEAMIDWS